ncbi:Phospholipase A2 domain-containing protein [Plasmodiophora brassicae]|uniref:Phospholipase A2 domain-containing protein n=1 Tax=Plasmodiophora brassicae TaxID=37360 RepID=A0A3P3Y9Y7_PLABS|nr:unnamed protein product [Plasmodiophora brassicae]
MTPLAGVLLGVAATVAVIAAPGAPAATSLSDMIRSFVDGGATCDPVYTCPSGRPPRPARRHRPSSNGCGAMGVTVSFSGFDLEPCCNEHDICYDTCGSNRDQCDATFASCLRRACQALPDEEGGRGGRGQCTGVANLFVSATKLSGCAPFIEAQTRACDCTERDL